MLAARLQAIDGARTFTLQVSQHCRLLLTARYFLMPFGFHLVIFYLIDTLPSAVQLSPASEVLSPLSDMTLLI